MRAIVAMLLAAVAFSAMTAQAAARLGQEPKLQVVSTNYDEAKGAKPAADEKTTSPKIVSAPAEGEEDRDDAVEVPDYTSPKSPADKDFDTHFDKIESRLDENQKNLADITKHVAESLHERKRLLLVGEEMHALMSLHRAAKQLHENQQEVEAVEEEIKKLGEEAEELIRERTELKRQIEEELKQKDEQLEATRGKLGELDQQLTELRQTHEHTSRLVAAWQERAKAIRAAREKHEEMDAMAHLVGGHTEASPDLAFPMGHEPTEAIPEVSANADDLAKLETSINEFANRHVHAGKAAKTEEAPKTEEGLVAPPAPDARFATTSDSLMVNNRE
jgi:DNA repair exonuclease SbcCD ATPase subunit